jgi:hypothetical protein
VCLLLKDDWLLAALKINVPTVAHIIKTGTAYSVHCELCAGMDVTNPDPVHAVAAAFCDLESPHSRLQAYVHSLYPVKIYMSDASSLRILSTKLESSEIKQLSWWLHARDSRYDILGNLPLELVLHILRYVDLRTAFRCRRISQRWAGILSLDLLPQIYIRPWYFREDQSSRDRQSLPLSTETTKVAEHIDAFCTGRPFGSLTMSFNPGNNSQSFHSDVHYCNGLLMLLDEQDNLVQFFDLRNGTHKNFALPSEQNPRALSEQLIVCCSDVGEVEIVNHLTGSNHQFGLESENARDVIAKGGTIAILHDEYVTTWDIETQTTCQFCICPSPRSHLSIVEDGIYITTKELDVIYYEVFERTEWECAEVSFVRYKLDGTPLTSPVRLIAPWMRHEIPKLPKPPISITGLVGSALQSLLLSVAYHEVCDDRLYRKARSIITDGPYGTIPACLWKDILYESRNFSDVPDDPIFLTSIYDFRDDTAKSMLCDPVELSELAKSTETGLNEWHSNRTMAEFLNGPAVAVMGDENFVVNISNCGTILIHCFDKEAKISLLNSGTSYADWRSDGLHSLTKPLLQLTGGTTLCTTHSNGDNNQ